jgi:hypothetical protein
MKRNPTRLLASLALLLFAAESFTAPAAAQAVAQTSPSDWQFSAILYLYLPQISGSTTFPTGQAVNITIDPNKLISNLNFAFMGAFEARKGAWGGFTDLIYTNVGGSESATRDFSIGGVAIPGSVTANLHLDVKATVWTTAGFYRALDTPNISLDVLLGARGLFLNQNLSWQFSGDFGPFVGPGRGGSGESNLTNWDAIVGLKGRWSFGDRHAWFVPYYLDVGTGASHLTWQGMAGVGYGFSWGSVIAVWRYLDYQFKSNDASLAMNGPAIGVAFHW